MQASRDAGKAWSDRASSPQRPTPRMHPLLIKHTGVAYLSWLTHEQGYRLLPLQALRRALQSASTTGRE